MNNPYGQQTAKTFQKLAAQRGISSEIHDATGMGVMPEPLNSLSNALEQKT